MEVEANVSNEVNNQDNNKDNLRHVNICKINKMNCNNSWNRKIEKLVSDIGENSAGYSWMHSKASNYYTKIDNWLGFLVIILTTLTGTSIFATLDVEDTLPKILTGLVVYLSGAIAGVQKYFNFKEKSDKHHISSLNFQEIYFDVQRQMSMYRKDRINGKKYMENITKLYNQNIMNSPNINNKIVKKFIYIFRDQNISRPNVANNIQNIEIQSNHSSNSIFHNNNNHSLQNRECFVNNCIVKYNNNSEKLEEEFSSDSENELVVSEMRVDNDSKIKYEVDRFINQENNNDM